MQNLSAFPDESFDLIIHPVSNVFCPQIHPVWKEAYRVFERVEVPGKDYVKRWWPNDSEGTLLKLDDLFLVNLPDGTVSQNREAG
jgi:hypothetical protein